MNELKKSIIFYGGGLFEDLRRDLHSLRGLRNEVVHGHSSLNPSNHFIYQRYYQTFAQEYKDYLQIQRQKHRDRQIQSFKLKFQDLVAARYTPSATGKLFDVVLSDQDSSYEVFSCLQKMENSQALVERINLVSDAVDNFPSTLQSSEQPFQFLIETITLTDDPLYQELKQALQVSADSFKPKTFIDYVLQQLCNHVKRYFKLLKRDIRQSFRRIIQLIFKNLDDESGDAPATAQAVLVFHLFSQTIIFKYDQRLYARYPQWATAALPGVNRGRTPGTRRGMFATRPTGSNY